MGLSYYASLGIRDVGLRLNSIGCPADGCRPRYREELREAIRPRLAEYCQTCRQRFDRNPLRILDCKSPVCRELSESLPKSHEWLCGECAGHFDVVKEAVTASGAVFVVDGRLVRGLDYYTKTVFEYTHGALGAQDALGGGGRYDGLVEELGGEKTPAVGFALGVERVIIAMTAGGGGCGCPIPLQVYGAAVDAGARRAMTGLLARVRAAGLSADMDFEGRSLKAQLRAANRRNALVCLILGEDELSRGEVTVKDMREDGGQRAVPIYEFLERIGSFVFPGDAPVQSDAGAKVK